MTPINPRRINILLGILVALMLGTLAAYYVRETQKDFSTLNILERQSTAVQTFRSPEDFINYLADGREAVSSAAPTSDFVLEDVAGQVGLGQAEARQAGRVSTTNVQVKGIDEPDSVKTDGTQIYISQDQQVAFGVADILPRTSKPLIQPVEPAVTKVIAAFPPEALETLGTISTAGNLLLHDKTLIVITATKVTGFDVSTPAQPKQVWVMDFAEATQLATARLLNGQLVLVTSTSINTPTPCPMDLYVVESGKISIPCREIYHPIAPIPADVTYTVARIDPGSGRVDQSVSFIGETNASTIFVSTEAAYVTYSVYADTADYLYSFYRQSRTALLPTDVLGKLERLNGYELSTQSKLSELTTIITRYENTLSVQDRTAFEEKKRKMLTEYQKQHQRELEKTGIVKIAFDPFSVSATGEVPGRVLNQFSIDEHNRVLRIATTTGGVFGTTEDSRNDVYTLGEDLKPLGSILDLGVGERIYSVRFVGDRGYVVTFKQVDPFFVLDLSKSKAPKKTGELKIPGFSSYLDPLTDRLILGVGQDGNQVKLTLFDVADPAAPKELATKLLESGWSEVQSDHHAFLHDPKHEAFFLPAGGQGYVVTYANSRLEIVKTISGQQTRRALYLNDFLYLVSSKTITVLRESDWETIREFTY